MMLNKTSFKLISFYLAFATVLISFPAQGWAMFIPNDGRGASLQADREVIRKALETTVVQQRLRDFGLSPEEAAVRIDALSDEQIHQFASRLDALQAGADGLGALIFLLLVAILVVVILAASGRRVIIR